MHPFKLGFSYCNVHLSVCTFMIYDKDDGRYDSLEVVIGCPLQSGFVWQFISPSPILNFEREGNHPTCCNLSLCILRQDELMINY